MKEFPNEDAPEGFLHAWFSEIQSQYGTLFYKDEKYNENNQEVEITEVSKSPKNKDKSSTHIDMQYLGLVIDFMYGGFLRIGKICSRFNFTNRYSPEKTKSF